MNLLTIRHAEPSDLPAILKIEGRSFAASIADSREVFEARMASFPEGTFVIAKNGTVAGFLCLELWNRIDQPPAEAFRRAHSGMRTHCHDGNEIYLSRLVIDLAHSSKGYGRLLFREGVSHTALTRSQVKSVMIMVDPEWERVRELYETERFATACRLPAFFEVDGEATDAIVMRRPLEMNRGRFFTVAPIGASATHFTSST